MTQLPTLDGTRHAPGPAGTVQAAAVHAAAGPAAVDGRLSEFFAQRIAAAALHGGQYELLWSAIRAAADGGKRLRPRFVLLAFGGLGGDTSRFADAAIDTAVAFELLHTAFLLHDDVIDGDTLRRGRPNLSGEFAATALFRGAGPRRARLWGESAAILAGDLLLHAAGGILARLDVPSAVRSTLLDVFERCVFVTAAGELADVGLSTGVGDAGLGEVLAMTEWKTAEYSVAGPLIAGAVLAGADDRMLDGLAEFGRLTGIAFQLGDDLLGVFGDEEVTGKSAVGDLRQGKETSLIAFARGTPRWGEIAPSLGRPDLSRAEAARLAAVLEECGARAFVERLLDEHVAEALSVAASLAAPRGFAADLAAIARSCAGRVA